jgi:hypothetical protein
VYELAMSFKRLYECTLEGGKESSNERATVLEEKSIGKLHDNDRRKAKKRARKPYEHIAWTEQVLKNAS